MRESLQVLDLSGNYFDDLGAFLDGLAGLEVLRLDDTNVVDGPGLAETLARDFPRLRVVTLASTLLDDASVERLHATGYSRT